MSGDTDEDGDVDGHDFLTWQRQFGDSSIPFQTIQVPEPYPLLLISTALLVVTRRIRLRTSMN